MVEQKFLQQLGIGVASLTFGVALSIFIYAAVSRVATVQALLLYVTSFLLMLRFWWRYTELFVPFLSSRNYWHFLFDFAVSFFGILAVLFVGNIQIWAIVGASAMVMSMIRCALSWSDAKKDVKISLKRTLLGSIIMFVVMSAVYLLSPFVDNFMLSAAVLVIVIVFIIYASVKAPR